MRRRHRHGPRVRQGLGCVGHGLAGTQARRPDMCPGTFRHLQARVHAHAHAHATPPQSSNQQRNAAYISDLRLFARNLADGLHHYRRNSAATIRSRPTDTVSFWLPLNLLMHDTLLVSESHSVPCAQNSPSESVPLSDLVPFNEHVSRLKTAQRLDV
jgi:hypothetical protein